MPVKAIPEGYHSITPYLMVKDADKSIEFYKKAFDAELPSPALKGPNGKTAHAEMKIGDSRLMIGSQMDGQDNKPTDAIHLHLYVPDCDAVFKKATAAGAKSVVDVTDQFYGDRSGAVKDPDGHTWWIATHKEDLSQAELEKRSAEYFAKKKDSMAA
jgi:PhnB protein